MVNTKGSLDKSQTTEKKVKVNQACNYSAIIGIEYQRLAADLLL